MLSEGDGAEDVGGVSGSSASRARRTDMSTPKHRCDGANQHLLSEEELAEWDAAIAEYHARHRARRRWRR